MFKYPEFPTVGISIGQGERARMSEPESGAPAKPQAKRSVSEQMGIPVTSVNPESMHMPPEAVERKPVTSNVTKFLFEYGKKQRFPEGTYFIREGDRKSVV